MLCLTFATRAQAIGTSPRHQAEHICIDSNNQILFVDVGLARALTDSSMRKGTTWRKYGGGKMHSTYRVRTNEALCAAASAGNMEIVDTLLNAGADAGAFDGGAIRQAAGSRHRSIAERLNYKTDLTMRNRNAVDCLLSERP
ncbi:hypothetical protein HDU87_000470 [Geranomyces variabilis]|uniref:Ankyrin repeat domain-containing protein n=1 Tax=Geranomyces variabilis TaxID=109894 RepID=A0AAD5TCQ1_9FUNG|nr:hypothetical protein HDU87_000470 [Geranomyces variabilis]